MEIIQKFIKKQNDLWMESQVTIAFLGDSVTQGCFEVYWKENVGIHTVFEQEKGYHRILAKLLAMLYPSVPVTVINAGISGDNAPFGPVLGNNMLEATFPTAPANNWRTILLTPGNSLNMSNADAIAYAINSYGGSGGTGYETRIRLYSGSEMFERTTTMLADSWNQVYADVSGWNYRNNVTKMEISFRATGSSAEWYGSRFQVDMVRTVEHDNVENEMNMVELNMDPFWQGTTMYNESVLMVSHAGELPEANLLFAPIEIISVRSARLDQEYLENVDWVLEGGKLKLTPNSRIPYLSTDELYYSNYIEGVTIPMVNGRAVLYQEGSYFHDRQIVITYTHAANAWEGPVPQLADNTLTSTFSKLRNGEPLTIVLYGDSIADGSNGSNFVSAPPYLPSWGELVAQTLEDHYGSHITFLNQSVGGTASQWGAAQAANRVAAHNPDLVIVAFGMNDGSGTGVGDGVSPSVFKNNILSIINTVRATNPNAEFVLVGTTLPNSETIFLDQQPYYFTQLQSIANTMTGVAAANMTAVHSELLEHKTFIDMTGNNVNHPNDFLSRWYAQFIVGMLKDTAFVPTQAANVRRIYSFETGVQGWGVGENVNSVNAVTSITNWPFGPQQGSYALEAQFPTQAADTWRTVSVIPEHPLDLSGAGHFYYYINSYGGSGGSGYETRIRLYSNSHVFESTSSMQADYWNRIVADIGSWAYKHEVTKIEISFRATGNSADWYGSRFQIDNVGYLLDEITLYDFEGTLHTWENGANVISVSSVGSFANSPTKPFRNAYAMEAVFPYMAADEWRTVFVDLEQPLNLSSADSFYYYINSYGGSGGTGYETRVRLYSGTDMKEITVAMNADNWNRIEMDISTWEKRNSITRIEISFRATGTSALWYSSRFQIDNVGYCTN